MAEKVEHSPAALKPDAPLELGPEFGGLAIPQFWEDREAYFRLRDELLNRYLGMWVAVLAKEGVIATGRSLLDVSRDAFRKNPAGAYIAKVGDEEKVIVRRRRASPGVEFRFDADYQPTPLPVVEAIVSNPLRTAPPLRLDRVIPDTGSDISYLPLADFTRAGLHATSPVELLYHETGEIKKGLAFKALVEIGPLKLDSYILPRGDERILGRDALNQTSAVFDHGRKVRLEP